MENQDRVKVYLDLRAQGLPCVDAFRGMCYVAESTDASSARERMAFIGPVLKGWHGREASEWIARARRDGSL
jgi:hypothetical protein